jgi:hypothetical protein
MNEIKQSILNRTRFWMPFLFCLIISFMAWNNDYSFSVIIILLFLPLCFLNVCELLWANQKEILELRRQIDEIKKRTIDSEKISLSDSNQDAT